MMTNKVQLQTRRFLDEVLRLKCEERRLFDLRPITYLMAKCARAFDADTNPLAMVTMFYQTIAERTGLDVRRVKKALAFLEDVHLLTTITEGYQHLFILHGLTTYQNDAISGNFKQQERNESKEKAPSPCTPSLNKEKKEKKEKPPFDSPQGGTLANGMCVRAKQEEGEEVRPKSGSMPRARMVVGSIDERRQRFMEEVRPFVEKYGRDTCNAFFSYWTELSKDSEYMRFERRTIWQTENRLIAWARHGMKFDAKKSREQKYAVADSTWIERPQEGERRRLQERLESVPPWAIAEVKKHGLWKDGINSAEIIGVLEQLNVRKVLSVETIQLLERWRKERKNVLKLYENV